MTECLIVSLEYLGLRSDKLSRWRDFASGVLGLQAQQTPTGGLRLRMDDKAFRYSIEPSAVAGIAFVGFQVDGASQLDELVARIAAAGVETREGTTAECSERGVDRLAWAMDPDGHRVEFFIGDRAAATPFAPGKPIGGFRTGSLGMGHLVRYTPRYNEMSAFYQSLLGFRLTDFHREPFEIEFLRVNARHHSIALISDPGEPRIHHTMVEYQEWDDVGRAYDQALMQPDRIAVSLGRHLNDHMTSFYMWSPDDFFVEIGWAGRLVDDAEWTPTSLDAPSLWGHVRYWQPPDKRAHTRALVEAVSARGLRAPVAVPVSSDIRI